MLEARRSLRSSFWALQGDKSRTGWGGKERSNCTVGGVFQPLNSLCALSYQSWTNVFWLGVCIFLYQN